MRKITACFQKRAVTLLFILRSFAADILRACARGDYFSFTYIIILKPDGHGDSFKVHPYESHTYIKPGFGFYFFNCDGVFQILISDCCERSAGMRMRNRTDYLPAVFLCIFALCYN